MKRDFGVICATGKEKSQLIQVRVFASLFTSFIGDECLSISNKKAPKPCAATSTTEKAKREVGADDDNTKRRSKRK